MEFKRLQKQREKNVVQDPNQQLANSYLQGLIKSRTVLLNDKINSENDKLEQDRKRLLLTKVVALICRTGDNKLEVKESFLIWQYKTSQFKLMKLKEA